MAKEVVINVGGFLVALLTAQIVGAWLAALSFFFAGSRSPRVGSAQRWLHVEGIPHTWGNPTSGIIGEAYLVEVVRASRRSRSLFHISNLYARFFTRSMWRYVAVMVDGRMRWSCERVFRTYRVRLAMVTSRGRKAHVEGVRAAMARPLVRSVPLGASESASRSRSRLSHPYQA